MKAKFLALVIVLGMSAPVFANGVPVVYTASGTLSLAGGTDSLLLEGKAFTLSLTIDSASTGTPSGPFATKYTSFISAVLTIPSGPTASITGLVIGDAPENTVSFLAIVGSDPVTFSILYAPSEWTGTAPNAPAGATNIIGAEVLATGAAYNISNTQLQVTPVPEPGTLTLLLGGLGVLGVAVRLKI